MNVLALDLGGTKLNAALFTEDGRILFQETLPLENRSGEEVGALITGCVTRILSEREAVSGIGISVPGISRKRSGTVWAPNIGGWDDYPLLQEVRLVAPGIPVVMDADRACYIYGEMWKGNARECGDAIFLAVGTGIGAGIVVDGKVLNGAHDIAGSVGWMALNKPYDLQYKNQGCFEYYASGSGIARLAKELLKNDPGYEGVLASKETITAHDVFAAFAEKDAIAIRVFKICIEFWGMAVANLVSIFNPEKIILGGGIFGPAQQFIPDIKKEALKWAQPISIQQVSIEAAALGSSAGAYGAAFMALAHLSSNHNPGK